MERRGPFVLAGVLLFLSASFAQNQPAGTQGPAASAINSDLLVARSAKRSSTAPTLAQKKQALASYSRLPLSFEPNQGQAPSGVQFLSRGAAYNLFLTDAGATLALQNHRQTPRDVRAGANQNSPDPEVLGIRFERPNAGLRVSGENELPGRSNYFIGKDPQKWRRGIPNYARVRYHDVYPGVDLIYYGNQGRLEYDFVVAPGAQPDQIGLLIDGVGKLELSASGELIVPVGRSTVRLQKPVVYQEIKGVRREIAGGYLLEKGRVKFRVGDYDHHQPLVIDPVLSFSTYFGGSGDELFIFNNIDGAITVDSNGNIYVAGETQSASFAFPGFPPGGYKSTCGTDNACNVSTGGSDVFIAKLNPAGSAVLAFTYLGGSGRDILALNSTSGGLVVDTTGVYVSGTTFSSDFPTTTGVFRPTCTNTAACTSSGDGFVTKLDVNLATLIFSTYLSGTGTSQAGQMQVDSQGNVYVIGQAESGYPAAGTLTPCSPASTCVTGFVTELNNTGTGQVFSDFLGGSGQDYVDALALDSSNNIYVLGSTTSPDFPAQKTLLPAATSGGIYTSTNGTSWTALNNGLSGLNVQGLAVNPTNGQVLIAGTTQGVFQSTNGGTSWTKVYAANGTAIAFDPLNTQTVYAGTGDGVNGLLKSTNGGSSWTSITTLPSYFMSAVAVDPINEGTLYVGTQGGGVWKSTNGGTSWTQIQTSSGLAGVVINAIVIDYTNSSIVYVGSSDQGIFVSTNGGGNWTQMNNGLVASNGGTATVRTLAIDPNTHTTLYAGTNSGVFKTTNSASTWSTVNNGLSQGIGTIAIRTIAVDPANSQNVYGGSGSAGLFFSSNGGGTWSLLNNLGPHGVTVLALFPAASSPTTVYAGTSYEFAFAAKINSGGGSLAYATLLGGNAPTYLWGIALDSSNNAYVAGQTYASNFPVSGSAFQKSLLGITNAVVAKLNSSGNALSYASYLAGSGSEAAYAIAVDSNQQAWLTGITSSDDFPLANALWLQNPGNHGNSDEGFVTQFNATGTGLVFSTYLGGEGNCQNCNGPVNSGGVDLTLDSSGNAYVMGFTNDTSFDTFSPLQSSLAGGYDAFVAKIGSLAAVTDLSICLLDSSGQCTTTPPPAVPAGEAFVLNMQVTNKSSTTPATGVVVGGRGGSGGIKAVTCTSSVGICEGDNSSGQNIPNGGFASLGTLAPGAVAQINVTLVGTQAGTFTVTVDVRENETDSNPADNSASTTLTILPGADLAVDMNVTASPSPAQVGSTLTYTTNITNIGPSNASNVTAVFTFSPTTAATFGTLPSGCTNTAQGTLSCTIGPLAAGASSPGTITATAVSLPLEATITVSNSPEADPDPVNNTLTLITGASTAGANNSELNGHYAFVLRGFDTSGAAITIAGSFTADGAGNITGGVVDINSASNGPSTGLAISPAPASSYSVGSDNRGQLTLSTSAGTATFDFAVAGVGTITAGIASLGHIIGRQTSSPNGSAISGVFKQQDPTAITTLPTGDWAYLDEGVDASGNRFVTAGRFTLSGINLTQGTEDFNDAGIFDGGTTTAVTFTGTFGTLDTTNGRVPLSTVKTSGGTLSDVAVYIVSSSETLFASTDAVSVSPVAGGSALRQDTTTWCPTTGNCAFTNSALNGNTVVYLQGNASSVAGGSKVNLGSLTFAPGSPTGTISGGFDQNDGGSVSRPSNNSVAASYSVAANGRVTITGGGGHSPYLYMVNTNQALLVGSDSNALGGAAEPQVGPIQLTTGMYAGGSDAPAASGTQVFDEVLTVTAGSSTFGIGTNFTVDANSLSGALHEGFAVPNFEIDDLDQPSGRFTFLDGNTGASPRVGYFVNPNRRIVINADPTVTAPPIIFQDIQTGGSSVQPDLAVSITANPSAGVLPGGSITYTITVTNLLSTAATNVLLENIFSPSLTVNSATTSQGTCAGGLPASLGSLSCTLGTVTQGTNITITIVAVAPASGNTCASSALGCIVTGASVTEDQIDFNLANNTAAVTTPITAQAATSCTGTTTNWVGGNGNWSNAAMWNTGVVPNSSSVNVCIDNGGPASQVTLDINASVGNLYIDSGSSLTISNNTTLLVAGNISNSGQIAVSAGANTTILQVGGGHNLTLSGGGTLTLSSSGGGLPLINQSSGGATLTNVDNTIQGLGQIGNNGLALVNQAAGTVNANAAGTLVLNTSAITNAGLIEATAGGTLQTSQTISNAGGTLAASGANSSVQLMSGTTVQGGTLNAGGGGTLEPGAGQTITLDGSTQGALTNAGTYTGANNTTTILRGTITNNGVIQLAAGANSTLLQIAGGQNTTLTGGGTLTLSSSGGGAAIINQTSGGATLTNVNNIIQGLGEIGNNGLTLVNQAGGTINANAAGTLTVDASAVTNQNLMEATGSGTLAINSTTVNNNASTILASGGMVQFTNTTIQGGTLNTLSNGVLGPAPSATVTLDGISTHQGTLNVGGTFTVPNNSTTVLEGTINNSGTILLSAAANSTLLQIAGGQNITLTGAGTITMSSSGGGIAVINQTSGGATLTNSSNTIQGTGEIGNNGLALVNSGIINANVSGKTLTVNPSSLTNGDTLEATGGGTLSLSNTTINNQSGTIHADGGGSQVQFTNGVTIESGTLVATNSGVLGTAAGTTATLDGSTLGQPITLSGIYTAANNSSTILLGTVNNTGSFLLSAGANTTLLQIAGGKNVILGGAGTVTMSSSGGGTPVINQTSGGATLTNTNNTIQGQGEIGNNGLVLINQATINANVAGQTLTIDATTPTNAGTMEATGGGILNLSNNVVNNQGGTIMVNGATSAVQFVSNATIQGGTLATANGGLMQTAPGNSITLDGSTHGTLTNAGTYIVPNNSGTVLVGTINNTGAIQLNATANTTLLEIAGGQNVTLTGAGTVTLSTTGAGTAIINQTSGGATLTNVNNLIQGQGQIGNNGLTLVNQAPGVVNANAAGPLILNGAPVTNQNLIEASGGGTLQTNTTISSPGGMIAAAGTGSTVQFFSGTTIQGGTLTTSSGGALGTASGNTVTLNGSTANGPVTNTGTYTGANNSSTVLAGTINNTGNIQIAAGINTTLLQIAGGQSVTLAGAGAVTLSTAGGAAIINQTSGGSTLVNAGNTIQGQGTIGNNGLAVTNQGTISVSFSGAGPYTQSAGSIVVPAATTDSMTSFSMSGGTAQVDGTLSSPVTVTGTGTLIGSGTVSGGMSNGGAVQPGDSPGILTVNNGNYTQTSAGALNIPIGGTTAGTQYSQLNVPGTATLGGTLNVTLTNGFAPASGNSFTILTAGSVSGTFATVNLPPLSSGSWQVTYSATSVVLAVAQSSIALVPSGPVNFGQVDVGTSSTQNVSLSINTALTLSTVQASGDYSVLSNSCALNTPLPANTICTLQVQFTPTKPGQRWFPLVVTDSNSNQYSFGLEGTGVGSALAFTPGIITTVAGNGTLGYSGDNGPATSAELYDPIGVAVDSAGNLFIADYENARIRKVNTSATITTVAGNGTSGYSGDGGPATSAELNLPFGVALDSAGDLYIGDFGNSRIREVDASGAITTVAGNGTQGYSGDNGPATSAELNRPGGVAVDGAGNLYIADIYNQRIRKVDASGTITTVAGNGTAGYNGDNIAATSAELYEPDGVAVDSAGNLYIADYLNQRIRKVDASGTITTVAGNGTLGYSGDGGPATSAELDQPYGVAVDSAGNLYIADTFNQRIRKVDASGTITTVAGTGTAGYNGDNIAATSAELYRPSGVAVDSAGNLYTPDIFNYRIRKVDVTTSALSFSSLNVGQTSSAQSVTVSDVGNAALNFSSFLASSNFLSQSVGNDCVTGTPLAVGANCTLGVAFAPTLPGNPLTGTLTVSDDAFNSPQSVGLSGIATTASQTITFTTNAPASAAYNSSFTVAATGGASGNPVTFTSSGVCSNLGATYTMTSGTGTCSVIANQAGNADYSPAPQVTQSTTATQIAPTVSFTGAPASAPYGSTFNVTATTNASTTAVITASGACSITGNTVTMTSGTGTCSLTASWAADANYTAASLSQSTAAVASADLAVAMTASPSPVPVLGSVTYQITVTNNGPSPATGVVLTDPIPANTVFASIDDLTDCAVTSGTLTCNFGSVAVGAGSAITVNLMLVPLAVPAGAGTFDNTATVTANEFDPTLANNTATQTVQVTGTSLPGGGAFRSLPGFFTNILAGNDDSSAGPVPMNLNLNFFGLQVSTVFVNNNGNITFNSALSEFTPFPLSTTDVPIIAPFFADVDTDFPSSGLVTYGNDTVNGRPAFGVNWPNVEYYGESGDETSLQNIFQVVLIDRSDVGAGDFDIEFNHDKIQWETGDASGGVDGLGGSSARVGYSNGSTTAGSFFELPGSGVPGSFLDTNTTSGLIYNTLNSTQPGRYLFQVRGGTVQSSADMAISGTGPSSASAGATVSYVFTVTNLGPNTATGVVVTDTLPAGSTFVPAGSSNICQQTAPGVVTCNVGSLNNGANAVITIQAALPPTASGQVTDTAVVSVPNNQDLNLANNTATVPTTILVSDLTITKTHSDPFAQSQAGATYTITVSNVGAGTTNAAVTVSDNLPAGLTATAISGAAESNWTCTLQPLGCTRNDPLAPGGSYDPITLTVNVAANAPTQVTNVATVSGGGEVNTANDTANDVTNIVAAAASVTTAVAVVPPSNASGTTVTYAAVVTNNGPSTASNVDLTDVLTGNATFVTPPPAGCTLVSPTSLDCPVGTLVNGNQATFMISVQLTGTGWISNTVQTTSTTPNPSGNVAPVQNVSAGGNTVTGAGVAVQPADSTTGASPAVLTFADVTGGGTTTLASTATGSAPPAGFRTGTPAVFYNIATTAAYSGAIGVALNFNGESFHHPAKVRLFHYENGAWVDRTVSVNPAGGYAIALVRSLSPFALFEPVDQPPVANPGPALTTAGTSGQGAKVTLNGSASSDPQGYPLTYSWTGPFPEGNGVVTGVSPTVTMPMGASQVTLVVNDGEFDSAPASQAITVTDFSMAVAAVGPTTIVAGGSLNFSVTASPQFGPFPAAITLACSGLPQGAACSFSSAMVNAGGTASMLTITTTARSTASLAPTRHDNHAPLYALWMPLPAILLMGAGARRRTRRRTALLMLLVLLGMMLLLVSCGGGSMGTTPVVSNGTPAGSYNLTVTGTTSGGLQHTTMVSFTVQ